MDVLFLTLTSPECERTKPRDGINERSYLRSSEETGWIGPGADDRQS